MSNRVRLAGQLIEARLSVGLSMRQFAERSGVDSSSISRFEDAQRLPSLELLEALVSTLQEAGADISWDLVHQIHNRAEGEQGKALVNELYPSRAEVGETAPSEVRNAREFVEALRDLHIWAGKPSMRTLEARAGGHVSKSTFHKMLNEDRLPRFDTLEAFLKACGVQYYDIWTRKWRFLTRDQDVAVARRGAV
ncbi:helix-turn-helix transcriptional regulator [Streptomyces sp. NPDC052164]|uniref:helix-turn-helix transcriptional regulator n=1 Tax=Streptomyces sp. NPDC052164 TaxID=3155529 RepID=UPI0034487355